MRYRKSAIRYTKNPRRVNSYLSPTKIKMRKSTYSNLKKAVKRRKSIRKKIKLNKPDRKKIFWYDQLDPSKSQYLQNYYYDEYDISKDID